MIPNDTKIHDFRHSSTEAGKIKSKEGKSPVGGLKETEE
jgi:hypothetical protein